MQYAYSHSTSKIFNSPVPISNHIRYEDAFDIIKCIHVQVVTPSLKLSTLFSGHVPRWILQSTCTSKVMCHLIIQVTPWYYCSYFRPTENLPVSL